MMHRGRGMIGIKERYRKRIQKHQKKTKNTSEKNTMIVVGNGSSLKKIGNGEFIDSFTSVCRINTFKLKKEITGTRTTHWFLSDDPKTLARLKDGNFDFPKCNNVFIFSYFNQAEPIKDILASRYSNIQIIHEPETYGKAIHQFCPKKNKFYSTGYQTIKFVLNEGIVKAVSAVGFDIFIPEIDNFTSYYGENTNLGNKYFLPQERENLTRLVRENKIKVITKNRNTLTKSTPNKTSKKYTIGFEKYSTVAYAPDELAKAIEKYSENFSVISNDHKRKRTPLHKTDLVHYHNLSKIKYKTPAIIQYHSEPERCDLEFKGTKLVIAQYHATLPEFKDCKVVRNIINFPNNPLYAKKKVLDKVRVAYSPSNRTKTTIWDDKGTEETLKILNEVKSLYPNKFEFDYINGAKLNDCIERKRNANVVIDECMTTSYHRSSLEGLALGKLTICSLGKEVEDLILKITGAETHPIQNIKIENLKEYLISLCNSDIMDIIAIGNKSREWMETYWHPKDIVKEFENIYIDEIWKKKLEQFDHTNFDNVNNEYFSDLIHGKRIAIVGPSKILEGSKMGEFIDSFDLVIRTNGSFNILDEIKEDYGSRCDILYVNGSYSREMYPLPVDWYRSRGMKILCMKNNYIIHRRYYNPTLPTRWINQNPRLIAGVKGPLLGTYILNDLLQYEPGYIYLTGMDMYQAGFANGLNLDAHYLPGYQPQKILDIVKPKEHTMKMGHDVASNNAFFKRIIEEYDIVDCDDFIKQILNIGENNA